MAYGVELLLPFDITLATFLVPNLGKPLSTTNLIAICMCQLQGHKDDLATIHNNMLHSHFASVRQFEWTFEKMIQDLCKGPLAVHISWQSWTLQYQGCDLPPSTSFLTMHTCTPPS
ncbi:hypothetical protein BJV74DRAFT_768544 [Russula compacta]|nr:hypothetical protein BJV74DRAFT_768544 [Russula compacta]